MKLLRIAAAMKVAFVVACCLAVHYCYRHHIVSYPIKERVDVVISRAGRKCSSYINVLSSFSTGFPDSAGSLEANSWPIQFRLSDKSVMYASIGSLLIAPDHQAERTYLTDSGVERRDHAIELYIGKKIDLCVEPNRLPQYHEAFLDCPTFFMVRTPGKLNSIEIIKGPNAKRQLGNGRKVESVAVTFNRSAVFEPDIAELSNLPRDHALASRIIEGKVYQKKFEPENGLKPLGGKMTSNIP